MLKLIVKNLMDYYVVVKMTFIISIYRYTKYM